MPSDTEAVQNADQFSLKRLDSFHLNQLTAKLFESPAKGTPRAGSGIRLNKSASPLKLPRTCTPFTLDFDSPIRRLGKNKLDKISE